MAADKPRLIYGITIRRGRFFKRFLRAVFLVLVVAGAYLALAEAARRGVVDLRLLDIGQMVAILLAGLLAVRGLYNLFLALTRRSESVRFYDKGFVWSRKGQDHKYPWHQLTTYREGSRGIYLLGRWPLAQWGANTLTMADNTVFRFTGRFGDTRPCADAIRRYTAYVTGVRMGRTLRSEQAIKLHPKLIIYPTGIESGKYEIHWSEVDVKFENGRLIIRRLGPDGKFKTVGRYARHGVDNVGGFLELSSTTIRNYQPERFGRARATS